MKFSILNLQSPIPFGSIGTTENWNPKTENSGSGEQQFKAEKTANELNDMATKHGLEPQSLQSFVQGIMNRMIFDGEQLTDLLESLELSWRERGSKERDLMAGLIPHLHKLAQGREISGLSAYE